MTRKKNKKPEFKVSAREKVSGRLKKQKKRKKNGIKYGVKKLNRAGIKNESEEKFLQSTK